jgi:hypothetical protein
MLGELWKVVVTPAKAGVQDIRINKISNILLLPGVQQKTLHPFGGVNIR